MTLRVVVFLLLWRVAVPYNDDPSTFLKDKCDPGMICHDLDVDGFQDYAVEFAWVDGPYINYEFLQWKNQLATERLTKGDDWGVKGKSRTVCRHPIPGADNKIFVEFISERVEVIKFYEEGKELAVDNYKNKVFRIMSDFIGRRHITMDNLKHSIIYNSWLFLNSTHAIDLDKYMHFDPAESFKLRLDTNRWGRLNEPYWSYGMEHVHAIPNEDIPIEFVDMITRNCFGNPKKYCTIDPRDGTIHYTPYPAVLRMGDFIMEQRWQEVYNDSVPVYRFHHIHMPENEVFYFSDAASMVEKLKEKSKPKDNMTGFTIRGVMPQPKEGDKIFELMKQRTTTTPPPIQSTTPPTSTLKPLPPDAYKPINYSSISEMEEETMPALEIRKEVKAASDFAGNAVAILATIFMCSVI
ncbi:unnamed protein product [Bursaphelenchus xylophilus]|uniref:(pine wood nematode) hypothetical protein n=1 Tax=Bursaphelenchus xylophilus TaxID=6326 RepID=A0A1I7SVK9_BURXY|nr:unnamed protein product [Bursaphelenchus xylophilus]CAG9101609.1 unnamed protein product [Bursaphelenchus xylophilus]